MNVEVGFTYAAQARPLHLRLVAMMSPDSGSEHTATGRHLFQPGGNSLG